LVGELSSSSTELGPTPQASAVIDDARPEFTPGEIAALGGTDNALVGLAQNSLNASIPRARVVLRQPQVRPVERADQCRGFARIPHAVVVHDPSKHPGVNSTR
jgi:hypothetical protein